MSKPFMPKNKCFGVIELLVHDSMRFNRSNNFLINPHDKEASCSKIFFFFFSELVEVMSRYSSPSQFIVSM